MPQPHGGSIGQDPYEPTDRDRTYVREHVWYIGQDACAKRLGISKSTLIRHFRTEMDEAETELELSLGKTAVARALDGEGAMLRYLLSVRFGQRWSPRLRHEHSGPGGGPIRSVDMGKLIDGKSEAELAQIEEMLEQLSSEGVVYGPGDDTGSPSPSSEEEGTA